MFQIVVDSAANIPATVVKEYDIHVLSFVNTIDDKPLTCFDPNLTEEEERAKGHEYYEQMRNGLEPKTGLISSGEFEDYFGGILERGEDVLYFSLSSNISGTYNSARVAADALSEDISLHNKVYLIDSLNASLAQGILAIYASEMRAAGRDIEDVYNELSTYPPHMNGVFTVGNLKHLVHTGRISGVKAAIGNILSIKPILRGNKDGFIVEFRKIRGRKAVLNELVDLVCNNIVEPEKQIIGIAHADCYEESLQVMQAIEKRVKVRRFINTSYDLCTGTHVGPDTIALFFMAKDRELGE